MSDVTPKWLGTMQRLIGVHEGLGAADNPIILGMATTIAKAFPEMQRYCAEYQHDEIPWCGLSVAYCMAVNGIRPPFDPTNELRSFLWADAWSYWGRDLVTPVAGAVMIFTRNGGGHVALSTGTYTDTAFTVIGGNQSDQISIINMPANKLTSIRWPN